ncbi:Uncharacterised protein [Starkeya nomas]|uniref:Uncharacterized protein n=1 Tax=Starkeya nomas TaxID=2666134 RepID=A0A5S9NZK1_9HYPH|nr:Uncharacterised protein [Starkeya nomas]
MPAASLSGPQPHAGTAFLHIAISEENDAGTFEGALNGG